VKVAPHHLEVSEAPITISTYVVSDNGEYLAVIYFVDDTAHLEVWDIRPFDNEQSTDNTKKQPQMINAPFATATFKHKMTDNIIIDISSKGSQVVLSSVESDGIPFTLYKTLPMAPADKDSSQPWKLGQSKTILDGNHYNIVAYYRKDLTNDDEEHEKCYTSDGSTYRVYNIQGRWSQIYSITLQLDDEFKNSSVPFLSIHGGYFAWITGVGVVTVWDFETGELVSHIYTGSDQPIGDPYLSPDGKLIAIPVKNTIQIRDTKTGIKLGVYNNDMIKDYTYEIVVGRDNFMTYDTANSTSDKFGEHDVRQIVSLSDLSNIDTIYLHQDYHVRYPQNADKSFFSYSHVSLSNTLKLF
jgi:hypothetical protein